MNWYSIIHDPETSTAHVLLHDDIGCGGKTSGDLQSELAALSPKKVELQIDSTGGNSITGINLHEIFLRYETAVLIAGKCCSAALTSAMAGRTIRILPGAKILIHSPAVYCHGTADELFDAAIEAEQLRRSVATILCKRTHQSAQVVTGWLSRDTWFTAADAIALGLADELAELPVRRVVTESPAGKLTIPPSATIPESERFFFNGFMPSAVSKC